MQGDRTSDIWASAMHYVKDAIRQTGFAYDIAKNVSGNWRKLPRPPAGGVRDGDGRRDFPAQQVERKIPRRYESSGAARLSQRVIEGDVVRDMRFGFRVQDRRRKEAEIAGGSRNVERARERKRLAPIDPFGGGRALQ